MNDADATQMCRAIGQGGGLGVVDDGSCTNNVLGCTAVGAILPYIGTRPPQVAPAGFGVIKAGSCSYSANEPSVITIVASFCNTMEATRKQKRSHMTSTHKIMSSIV